MCKRRCAFPLQKFIDIAIGDSLRQTSVEYHSKDDEGKWPVTSDVPAGIQASIRRSQLLTLLARAQPSISATDRCSLLSAKFLDEYAA